MARIRSEADGTTVALRARTRVGRSRGAELRLVDASISGEHALLLWTGQGWTLRDLGSTNGTSLGERRLNPGQPEPLAEGDTIGFGFAPRWRVLDLGPPGPLALEGERVISGLGELLLLPDAEHPQAAVARAGEGWWLEDAEGGRAVADGDEIAVGTRRFRLHLPEPWVETWRADSAPPAVDELELRFQVSLDEEHVTLTGWHGGREFPLHARSYHYLLLTLARARLADAADPSLPPAEQGWLDVDRLCRMLGVDERTLNTWVYRVRRLFAEAGVLEPAAAISRRPGKMRIGSGRLVVGRLED